MADHVIHISEAEAARNFADGPPGSGPKPQFHPACRGIICGMAQKANWARTTLLGRKRI